MLSDLSNLHELDDNHILYNQNEEDQLEEEDDTVIQYLPLEISEFFEFLSEFQEEIIQNFDKDIPLSIPVIKFLSNDQIDLLHFENFLNKNEGKRKILIKTALQLVDSIIRSKRSVNHCKLFELLSYFNDDIITLFKSNELIDIFINDKKSIFILYELKLISIQDIISIPFITQSKPSHILSSINEYAAPNVKNTPKNNSNSLIRRSFSTSASIFNVNSNLSPNYNLRNSTNSNFKISGNIKSISNSEFSISSRKKSFDFSVTPKVNLNNNIDSGTNKFEFSGSPNEEIISLFQPEIDDFDSNIKNIFPNLFELSKKIYENEKNDAKIFLNLRSKFQNENPIAQLIINDDVIELQNAISNPLFENIDSITINHSLFERVEFLNDKRYQPTILEFAAFCGSVKIFKYLLLDLHGNSSSSSLPPLHLYQQQQLQQREQLIKQQREQLLSLQSKQSGSQIGLIQKQQQIHIQKQHEQLLKFQAQYQQNFQQQQTQFQQQQQKQIVSKMPQRLHLFAVAGGNAEIIHILEQEGVFSDEKKLKEAIEISIKFHQNDIFDYFLSKSKFEPTIDTIITCIKSNNYYCFISLFDLFHTSIVSDINKKGKEGENILHTCSALGRLPFVIFLTSIDYELEKELIEKSGKNSENQGNITLNVNVRDSNGLSALHLAAAGGHIEIIEFLVDFYKRKEKQQQQQQKDVPQSANSVPSSPLLKLSPLPDLESPNENSATSQFRLNQRPMTTSNFTNQQELKESFPMSKSQIPNSPQQQTTESTTTSNQPKTPPESNLPQDASSSIPTSNSIQIPTPPESNFQQSELTASPNPRLQSSKPSLNQNSVSIASPILSPSTISPSPQSPTIISNSKSAPNSPKLITLPNSSLLQSNSTSIRRKINSNSVSFSKTVSLGSLSQCNQQLTNTVKLNLNVKDFKGRSAAQLGYEFGFSDVAKFLVSQSEFDVNSRDDSGIALIHIAATQNDLEFIEFMTNEAKSRINLNIETKQNRRTAFLIAASNGNLEMVKYLISLKSVNKKCRDIQGQMAHHIACSSSDKKRKNEVNFCVKNKKDEKGKKSKNDEDDDDDDEEVEKSSAVMTQIDSEKLEEMKNSYIERYTNFYLTQSIKQSNTKSKQKSTITENDEKNNSSDKTEKEADSSIKSESEVTFPVSSISASESSLDFFHCNNLDVLKFLINNEGFDPNDRDEFNQTPLHHACKVGNIELVEFLSSVKGVDVNARDKEGRTPLVLSFISDSLDIAKFMLESTRADIKIADNDGRNGLHLSAQGGHFSNVMFIFELQDKRSAMRNRNNRRRSGYISKRFSFRNEEEEDDDIDESEKVEELENDQLDVNKPDNFGRTCLHLSFESGNTELIKFVLRRKDIDLNARDKGGRTLLHYAASFNFLFVIYFLQSQGPIPRKISYGYSYNRTPGFTSTTSTTAYSSPSRKFDIKNVNAKANHDWTALHFAAAGGFVEMCEFLVSVKYVNANARDSTGMTPLHLAVLHEKIDAVKFLVEVPDVYVNSQDNEGRTPLHLACSMGLVDIIKVLVKCKEIDLTRVDKKSQTAFKHLTVENQKALAYLFK